MCKQLMYSLALNKRPAFDEHGVGQSVLKLFATLTESAIVIIFVEC